MATGVENVTPTQSARAPLVRIGTQAGGVNVKQLEAALREKLHGEVRFDAGSRALYATDGSNYRQPPIGVVIPRDEEDVIHAIGVCRDFGAPVLNRGAATSLAGQCCNVAVIIDFSKYMHKILHLNPDERFAWVQPGIINDDLRNPANQYGLTFGPDPATHNRCTVGGMIGNNSCGIHALMNGKTSENIEELEILTYEGHIMRVARTSEAELDQIIRGSGPRAEIYRNLKSLRDRYADEIRQRYPKIPRRVSGYNLDKLLPEAGFQVAQALVGSESTLVTVLAAKTKLIHNPPYRVLLVLGYPDIFSAAEHLLECLAHSPLGLEGLDSRVIHDLKRKGLHPQDLELMPEVRSGEGGWLLVEFGGDTREEAEEKASTLMHELQGAPKPPSTKLYRNVDKEHVIWKIRESALGATAYFSGHEQNWEGWEDSAAPPANLSGYLRDLRRLFKKYGYTGGLYGHFGDGCVHTRINYDLKTREGVKQFQSFISEAADTVLAHGGSLSGEHGDGQSRAEFLPRMFGEKIVHAFEEYKSIWDPRWKMNPGKVIRPYRIDENLRYGPQYHPRQPKTHFAFSDDDHSFAHATERCVGIGECRRLSGGTMCPSFMVTREEMHSTRGRARLLFEMLQGDPLHGEWRNEAVKESLDLCLSCKGCKGDCPVNVDMAAYKAEFLSHYYQGRLRPRNAYASGLIFKWAKLASRMPLAANLVTHAPVLAGMSKFLAGYAQERRLPFFALETFKQWWRRRPVRNQGKSKVLLWADTFTNYFQPEVAKAAVDVLEDAGYQVDVPMQDLCCGRPLYDYGMLDRAKGQLAVILRALQQQIEQSIPIVVLEPSCATVFRDEMPDLLWGNIEAQHLARQVFLLSEFLEKRVSGYRPPRLHRKIYVHGHCHHKALMKLTDEKSVLKKMGADSREIESGCCGMAGAFGYEAGDHYTVSMACAERALLPAVRDAEPDAVILADGFSCREQIEQGTGRKAMHLSQAIQMALPNRKADSKSQGGARLRTVAIFGIGIAAAAAAVWAANSKNRH